MNYQLSIIPKFPARVNAGPGITIDRSNGVYTISASADISTPVYASRVIAAASTIPTVVDGGPTIIQTLSYATVGDGGGAIYIRAGGSTTGGFQSADGQWWALGEQVINPKMLGAKFDNSNDDGPAINSAISLSKPIFLPVGIARSSVDIAINVPTTMTGAGGFVAVSQTTARTTIRFTADKSIIVSVTGAKVVLSDFGVDSTIAAGSRSASNIRVAANSPCILNRIYSVGGARGFEINASGTFVDTCFATGANLQGFYGAPDGTNPAFRIDELTFINCYAVANGLDGFKVVSTGGAGGAGLRLVSPETYANGGSGITATSINDILISDTVLSSDTNYCLILASCHLIALDNVYAEGAVTFDNVHLDGCSMVSAQGGFVQAAQNAVTGNGWHLNATTDAALVGLEISSNHHWGLWLNVGCTRVTVNGCVINNGTPLAWDQAAAIRCDASGPVTVIGNDLSDYQTGVAFVGTFPAGSYVAGNIGYNPVGTSAPATVGASPATITAGASAETHYVNQSATNTATIAKNSRTIATLKEASTYYTVQLGPGESYVVTWVTTAPTYTRDIH